MNDTLFLKKYNYLSYLKDYIFNGLYIEDYQVPFKDLDESQRVDLYNHYYERARDFREYQRNMIGNLLKL